MGYLLHSMQRKNKRSHICSLLSRSYSQLTKHFFVQKCSKVLYNAFMSETKSLSLSWDIFLPAWLATASFFVFIYSSFEKVWTMPGSIFEKKKFKKNQKKWWKHIFVSSLLRTEYCSRKRYPESVYTIFDSSFRTQYARAKCL